MTDEVLGRSFLEVSLNEEANSPAHHCVFSVTSQEQSRAVSDRKTEIGRNSPWFASPTLYCSIHWRAADGIRELAAGSAITFHPISEGEFNLPKMTCQWKKI
jgi:hypothetical protein